MNFFLGCVGVTQVTRIMLHQRSVKDSTIPEVADTEVKDSTKVAKEIAENPEAAAKQALH